MQEKLLEQKTDQSAVPTKNLLGDTYDNYEWDMPLPPQSPPSSPSQPPATSPQPPSSSEPPSQPPAISPQPPSSSEPPSQSSAASPPPPESHQPETEEPSVSTSPQQNMTNSTGPAGNTTTSSGSPLSQDNEEASTVNTSDSFHFWNDKVWTNTFFARIFAEWEIPSSEVSLESVIPFPPLFSEAQNQFIFPFLVAPDKILLIIALPLSNDTIFVGKDSLTVSGNLINLRSAHEVYRVYSFMDHDSEKAFLCIETLPTVTVIDISPYTQLGENIIPHSHIKSFNIHPLRTAVSPAVGYAGKDTFALVDQQTIRIISLNNAFQEVIIGNKEILAFQNNGRSGPRPIIAFPSRLTSTNKPVLIYPNGEHKTTREINPQLLATIDKAFLVSLSPQYIGYDTFTETPTSFLWDPNLKASNVWVGDWIKDETNWISVMTKTNYPLTSAPPAEAMHPTIANAMSGKGVYFKHVGTVCLAQIYHYCGKWHSSSPYGTFVETFAEGWWLTDFITDTTVCIVLTAPGERRVVRNEISLSSINLSPPTFVPQFGSWFGAAAFSFRQGSNRSFKIALLRVAHPQFFSQYVATVPAIETFEEEGKFAILYCSLKYPKRGQKWKVALVRVDDSTQREIVADMTKHITSTEKWEKSYNRNTWQEIPEGDMLSGNEAWIRVKIPRAVLEWKKDIFLEKFGANTPFRLVFISEPGEVKK